MKSSNLQRAEAALELLARRKGRNTLEGFITYTKPDYIFNWHHRQTMQYLEAWVERRITRLILCEPPRHGKSERVSRRLPAYIFGRNPDARIIGASYSADLAAMLNRDVQRIITGTPYQALFPNTRLNEKNVRTDAQGSYLRNSELFEIVGYRGTYRSVGRGGGVTGMGGDYIIVDDPIKDREEADSERIRDTTWDWYTDVLRTRAEENACILLTVTRWHLDDLVGRLLELQRNDPNADQWVVLVYPAEADPKLVEEAYGAATAQRMQKLDRRAEGEALWPSKYDKKALAALKATVVGYAALYQQSPLPKGGRLFERSWFKLIRKSPRLGIRVRYWDKAGTQGAGKYTAGVLMCFDGARFIVEDVVRRQVGAKEREELIKSTTAADYAKYGKLDLGDPSIKPYTVWLEREGGSGGKESAEHTILNLAGYPVYSEAATGSKEVRAAPFASMAEAGNVYVLEGEWLGAYLSELEYFPKGRYSDQVDGSSGGYNKLALGWEAEGTYYAEDILEDYSAVSISEY